jgi:hypothetical protein
MNFRLAAAYTQEESYNDSVTFHRLPDFRSLAVNLFPVADKSEERASHENRKSSRVNLLLSQTANDNGQARFQRSGDIGI